MRTADAELDPQSRGTQTLGKAKTYYSICPFHFNTNTLTWIFPSANTNTEITGFANTKIYQYQSLRTHGRSSLNIWSISYKIDLISYAAETLICFKTINLTIKLRRRNCQNVVIKNGQTFQFLSKDPFLKSAGSTIHDQDPLLAGSNPVYIPISNSTTYSEWTLSEQKRNLLDTYQDCNTPPGKTGWTILNPPRAISY